MTSKTTPAAAASAEGIPIWYSLDVEYVTVLSAFSLVSLTRLNHGSLGTPMVKTCCSTVGDELLSVHHSGRKDAARHTAPTVISTLRRAAGAPMLDPFSRRARSNTRE